MAAATATNASTPSRRSERRPRTSNVSVAESGNDMRPIRIVRDLSLHYVGEQLRVWRLEQCYEGLLFGSRGGRIPFLEIAFEQHVQLAHAPPATPAELSHGWKGAHQCLRSAIFFLISAMALAGFRSFGQASVQFMMV